uniref:Uncharacterized protein n=1 Tax=Amphimedon queenslandica TaxID=400682 RepID=A0A1X7U2B9_AMPQE
MKQSFDCYGEEATSVIDIQELLFPEFTNFDDTVSTELCQHSPRNDLTQEALQLIFKSFASTTLSLVLDHLPGGQYHSVIDPQIALEVAFVPTTNSAQKRDFAILDGLLSQKPNDIILHWNFYSFIHKSKQHNGLQVKVKKRRKTT